jgi:UDP-N-acetylmuramoyl-tripeptide--D-alanyl-D-alanine ligase
MAVLKKIIVFLITLEARLVLMRHKPKVIAITGSVGKTTTKDAVYAALKPHVSVERSKKSFNSDIGVPLTVLGLENPWSNPFAWAYALVMGLTRLFGDYPEWLILEVGADRPGDIRNTARWLKPLHVIYTGVPQIPAHIEYFSSADEVFKEKRSLAEYQRAGGKLFVNADDMRAHLLKADYRGSFISYGYSEDADFRASHEEVEMSSADPKKPAGIRFRLEHAGSSVPVVVYGTLGRPRIMACLAALAVADTLGIDAVSASAALAQWQPTPGRMRLIDGVHDTTIIDDTYNSSPVAALAALESLRSLKTRTRKIALMGDMLELGKESKEAHREVGERAADVATMLITVGFRSRAMGEAALDAGMPDAKIREYEQGEALRAAAELKLELKKHDIILIKGSQGMRMEHAVKVLMAHPEQAGALLVRQDEEWKDR